jgi:hypothetical protein
LKGDAWKVSNDLWMVSNHPLLSGDDLSQGHFILKEG